MAKNQNDLTLALNTFHNSVFEQFKVNRTKEDAKILENLLNYISTSSSNNSIVLPKTIQECLTQINLQDAKKEIQILLSQKFPNLQSLSANEFGDWAEYTVALLGQVLSGMDFKDLDLSKGIVGDSQRIRQIPEEVKDYIQKQYLNINNPNNEKWLKLINPLLNDGFVFTSPVQAKVDVDYTVFSQNMTIQSDIIKRLLSYRISVKETAKSTAKLEIINVYAALLSCYAAVYPEAQAAHIARFYLERKKIGKQFLIHADHITKLSALTGFGSINENAQTITKSLLVLPDLLAGYDSNTSQWHVESVAEIVARIPSSKVLLNSVDSEKQVWRIYYNFSNGTFTKTK